MNFSQIVELLEKVSLWPFALLIGIWGLYIYWSLGRKYNKDNNSLFDLSLVASLFAFLMARIAYIIEYWKEYSQFAWFYIPYERYGEDVYLFRLMPWRLFRLWDGGYTVLAALVGFIAMAFYFVVRYKKWDFREMFKVINPPIYFLLGSILILMEFVVGSEVNVTAAIILLVGTGFYLMLDTLLNYTLRKTPERKDVILSYSFVLFSLFAVVITCIAFIPYANHWLDWTLLAVYLVLQIVMFITYFMERVEMYRLRVKEARIKRSRKRSK